MLKKEIGLSLTLVNPSLCYTNFYVSWIFFTPKIKTEEGKRAVEKGLKV